MRHFSGDAAAVTEVQPRRFERVNGDIAAQCHEFVVALPRRARQLQALRLAPHRPVLRFHVGPGYQQLPDGRSEPMGDIVHTWVPVRATGGGRSPGTSRTRMHRPNGRADLQPKISVPPTDKGDAAVG